MTNDPFDSISEQARARLGRVLRDKWRLDALLGVGGMAAVYAATHRNGARAAIKLLHPPLSLDANLRSRFLREGYVANSVGHRGAVAVLDDDVCDDGSVFLVMELLQGETLEARRERKRGVLDASDVLSAADQLLDVLASAHTKGIVHRDLKPENVFVTVDGVVKVLDFGIAKVKQLSGASVSTRTGSTMGTPAFMAPEQARGLWDQVDAQSDLWAVGATMFALLTGRLVHHGRSINEQLLAAMTKQAPSLGSEVTVPSCLVRVVDRSLAFQKAQRWPDAASMQEAVREAYHAIYRNPITTAARLTVPPEAISVPSPAGSRIVSSAPDAVASTNSALSQGRTGVGLEQRSRRLPRWSFVPPLASLLVVFAVALIVFRRPRSSAPTGAPEPGSVGTTREVPSALGANPAEPGVSAPVESATPSAVPSQVPPGPTSTSNLIRGSDGGKQPGDAGRIPRPSPSTQDMFDKRQ